MPRTNTAFLAFNRGEIATHALGRIDVEQLRLAAQTQVNWLPLTVGPMIFRPGTQYLGSVYNNAQSRVLPFIFGTADTAILEMSASLMRVWVDDAVLTAASVSTSVTNGDFSSATGWTLTAASGASATISGDVLTLNALAFGSSAFCERSVTVGASDQNVKHRLRIVVTRGPVTFQVGSSSGGTEYIAQTDLGTGTHSIAFTPTGTFYVRFSTREQANRIVDSITVESSGAVTLPTPWTADDLSLIRYTQSGDIVYVACEGFQPRQIERRDNNSWSIVLYQNLYGPFVSPPTWAREIRMDPDFSSAAVEATFLLDATSGFFQSTDVQRLIRIYHSSQVAAHNLAGSTRITPSIRVNGVSASDRTFSWVVSGTWVGTLTLYRSIVGPDTGFVAVTTVTANGSNSQNDSATFANVETWYRVGFADGAYTSGVAVITFTYGGSKGESGQDAFGVARILGYTSAAHVTTEPVSEFHSNEVGIDWDIGKWSDSSFWPSACAFYDGRLFWAGIDQVDGSVSDDFTNFDDSNVTASGPINRSFGYGTFATVNWLLPLQRLIAGRDMSIVSIRSSAFDAPLTPTDFTMRDCSSHGAAALSPVAIDSSGIFVDKSGRRVHELAFDAERNDYGTHDLTRLNPDVGDEGFVDLAVQRQPDTRVHFVRGDGVVAVLCHDKEEGLEAWWRVQIAASLAGDAVVESVCVLPSADEDAVYYVVKRTINGATKRYLERFSLQSECVGGTISKNMDSHVAYESISASTTLTGLSHLEGETVCVWGNGKDLGTKTATSGQITGLSESVTNACVGLSYTGRFKSAKLAYSAALGTPLTQKKKVEHIGLVLADTHYQGLEFGPDFDTMDNLPLVEEGVETDADTIWSEFDVPMTAFPGEWHTDSRLCLQATSPRPATVIALALGIVTHDKA